MARKIRIRPVEEQKFNLADGTTVKRKLGHAIVEVDLTNQDFGVKRAPSVVVIGEDGDSPLLGVLTLENMGLIVDPFKRTVRPMKLMLG